MRLRSIPALLALGVAPWLPALTDSLVNDAGYPGPATDSAQAFPAGCRVLSPGQSIQAAVIAAPEGTAFCLQPGIYRAGEIWPKDRDQFIGAPGAILDGDDRFGRAIANYHTVNNVVIRGLEIRNYTTKYGGENGAIAAFSSNGWLIENNHVHHNDASGINTGWGTSSNIIVRNNVVDHNGCGGINAGGINTLIQGNEVSFNDYLGAFNSASWSCGGGKTGASVGLQVIGNWFHDNNGRGYWLDGGNASALIQGNRFDDNSIGGLMLEINDANRGGPNRNVVGTGIRVLQNSFTGNGLGAGNRVMFGPAIQVAASDRVEIAQNVIAPDNAHAVTLNYTYRAEAPRGLQDVRVHDNVIGLRKDGTNLFRNVGRIGFYTKETGAPRPTATFTGNHYFFDDLSGPHFSPYSPSRLYNLSTWTQWRAAGCDVDGTVAPVSQFPWDGVVPTPSPSTPQSPGPSGSPTPSPSPSPPGSPTPSASSPPAPSATPTTPAGGDGAPQISGVAAAPDRVGTSTTISFRLSESATVSVDVRNRSGRIVATVLDRHRRRAGLNSVRWEVPGIRPDPGPYTIRLAAADAAGNVGRATAPLRIDWGPCGPGRKAAGWREGTPGADCLVATASRDRIRGGAGQDIIRGGPGSDTLRGGSGNDFLYGGSGKDFLYGGPGFDVCYPRMGRDVLSGCEAIHVNRHTHIRA